MDDKHTHGEHESDERAHYKRRKKASNFHSFHLSFFVESLFEMKIIEQNVNFSKIKLMENFDTGDVNKMYRKDSKSMRRSGTYTQNRTEREREEKNNFITKIKHHFVLESNDLVN